MVRIECGVSDARVVVDRDIEELPACSAGLIARITGDAVASLDDACELLDVAMSMSPGASCS